MRAKLPPVDTYRLVADGIEAPLRYGIRRAYKHATGPGPSDAEIERIVEEQSRALLDWFCETFRLE